MLFRNSSQWDIKNYPNVLRGLRCQEISCNLYILEWKFKTLLHDLVNQTTKKFAKFSETTVGCASPYKQNYMTLIIRSSSAPVASWIYGMIGPVKTTILAGVLLSSGLIAGSLSSSIPLLVLFVGVICGMYRLFVYAGLIAGLLSSSIPLLVLFVDILCGTYRLHVCILHAVIPRKDLDLSRIYLGRLHLELEYSRVAVP